MNYTELPWEGLRVVIHAAIQAPPPAPHTEAPLGVLTSIDVAINKGGRFLSRDTALLSNVTYCNRVVYISIISWNRPLSVYINVDDFPSIGYDQFDDAVNLYNIQSVSDI